MFPVPNTPYNLAVDLFGRQLQHEVLVSFIMQVTLHLGAEAHSGKGAVKPPVYVQTFLGLIFVWNNRCGKKYGSYEELMLIVAELRTVTARSGVIPAVYQNREAVFGVFLQAGGIYVGDGSIIGDPPDGIEVE